MSDPIEPALTPEEWAGISHAYPQKHLGHTTLDLTGGHIEIEQLRGGNRATQVSEYVRADLRPDSLHAVAALALYRQPFGFTREDVVMLRQVQIADYRDEWRRAFDSLADRIEALLPPEGR